MPRRRPCPAHWVGIGSSFLGPPAPHHPSVKGSGSNWIEQNGPRHPSKDARVPPPPGSRWFRACAGPPETALAAGPVQRPRRRPGCAARPVGSAASNSVSRSWGARRQVIEVSRGSGCFREGLELGIEQHQRQLLGELLQLKASEQDTPAPCTDRDIEGWRLHSLAGCGHQGLRGDTPRRRSPELHRHPERREHLESRRFLPRHRSLHQR